MSDSYKLSDIYELQMGKTPSRDISDYWADGQYDWISIADLSKCEKYINQTKERITNRAIEESGIKVIPTDTIIMSFKLSIGKVAITQRPVYSNEAIMAFIDKGVTYILPQYAFYLFSAQKWDKGTNRAVMGATLNKATLSQYRVSIHNADEQAEIVNRLNKITDLINFRRKQIQKIDDLVKSQFIEMFGDVVYNNKRWVVFPMSTVAPIKAFKGEVEAVDGKVWLLNLDMIEAHTGDVQEEVLVGIDDIGASTVAFNRDNILYSKLRPYLNKVVYPKKTGYATSELVPLRPDINLLNKVFFTALLRSDAFVHFIREQVAGAKMPRVSMDIFKKFDVICPPIELQNQFAHFVEQTDKSKVLIREHLFLINRLRKVEKT